MEVTIKTSKQVKEVTVTFEVTTSEGYTVIEWLAEEGIQIITREPNPLLED